jgi:DNA oxidative demethylase
MPAMFSKLASGAAEVSGFPHFEADACLINRYAAGSRLSLHQDCNERDFGSPIVSISLGLPANFLWGGKTRATKPTRVRLTHGDVVVWGGAARMTFHGIDPLRDGIHCHVQPGSQVTTAPCNS